MACRYIYKGHVFESELALDDFIMDKLPFEPILGDMVFSNTTLLNKTVTLLNLIAEASKKAREAYREVRRNKKKLLYNSDGEILLDKPPYIGVNRFLGLYRYPDPNDPSKTKQLIPEFEDENYWKLRYADWKTGQFNENEQELFGVTNGPQSAITDPKKHEKMRELMENKWKNQAKAGDAIHNVLLLFFTLGEDGKYLFEMSDKDFLQYCLNNLDKDNKDFITEPVIKKTILYARTLHEKIKSDPKLGENCLFFPEFTITEKTNTTNPDTLLGMIDLLIIDKNGCAHILDYKTSLHEYDKFGSAKQIGYAYLLAVYKRMLEKSGINVDGGVVMIAPIQIKGFHKDTEDKWVYDDIESVRIYETLNIGDLMWENIDQFMVAPLKISISTDLAISTITEGMNKLFPDYSEGRLDNEIATKDWLKRIGRLKKNENGEYVFKKFEKNEGSIVTTDDVEFVKRVTEYLKKQDSKRTRQTLELKSKIKDAIENGIDTVEFLTPFNKEGNLSWLKDTISPYCNGNWKVSDEASDLLKHFGIIMLETNNPNVPPQIDFIRVSTKNLSLNYRKASNKDSAYKSRKSLIGCHESDIQALSKLDNLMMEAAVGNVELMETMLTINLLTGLKKEYVIGNIQVVNPLYGNGLLATNEELFYCFNELAKYHPITNKFANGTIKLATKYELVLQKVAHVLASGALAEWKDSYKIFKGLLLATSIYDKAIEGPEEIERKIQALQECLNYLTGKNLNNDQRTLEQKELDKTYSDLSKLKKAHIDLYNTILTAITNLRGINFRLQLDDHHLWFSDIMKVGNEGLTGNYSDNPGNLKSETLNLVTKLVTEAYQNTRAEILQKNVKLRKLVDKLKKDKSFGTIKENTLGNQVSLYKEMYEEKDGDIFFKNPNLFPEGSLREFLEFILHEINRDRFPTRSIALLNAMKESNNPEYYRVPLCVGGSDTTASTRGLLSMFRSKLEYLLPAKAWELAKKKLEGVFNKEDSDRKSKSELLYKMTNMFDVGNDVEKRLEKIAEMKRNNIPLELNFETLVLKHMFAYSVQRNMDNVFPLIKAAMIHILTLGALQNTVFNNDTKYLKEYIENKIFNKSIIEPENERWVKHANMIKKAASMFTLAVAPVLMFYQPLLGLWNDISLMIRKPDQKNSFTFQNFMSAVKLVFGDLAHFSNKPTLCLALNELYGINDMDMNTYVERISSAKKGIWNMSNFLFKFASRPDFYNRMTIFTSLMMGDGCLEAHSINSEGKLIYDWTKDERFSKFALAVKNGNPNSSDPEVAKLRSLYYTIALLFVNEHAKVEINGELVDFELNMNKPMKLPRAYTNKLAESMKSLGDDIYGYYSHEKKSLIMSTAIGSLWLLFRTYWSGKKNQYLAHGGVKLQGNWEHYTENNKKYYYQVNENGIVLYDLPIMTKEELEAKGMRAIAPVMRWRGLWQEGIILTLSDMVSNMWNKKSIVKGWKSKFGENVDPYLRKVYKSNMQLLAYDFIMFAVIGSIFGALLGDWLDKLKADNKKNKDLPKGLGIAAANVAVMSVKNSFLDFNFFSSIGDPFGLWTPFAIEWGTNTLKNWYNVAVGDEDFWDGVVKTSGGLKQIKPALDAIKPDMFRTEREGGTFNKK